MSTPLLDLALIPHVRSPQLAAIRVRVQVAWQAKGHLHLRYTIEGPDLNAWVWPRTQGPGAADGLWQHTCAEAFFSTPRGEAYHEFNFSPSLQWAHYAFVSERVRAPLASEHLQAPTITVQREATVCHLDVMLPTSALPQSASGWDLAVTAVLEHADGDLSYWALRHPREVPDFHHPAGRSAHLPAPAL